MSVHKNRGLNCVPCFTLVTAPLWESHPIISSFCSDKRGMHNVHLNLLPHSDSFWLLKIALTRAKYRIIIKFQSALEQCSLPGAAGYSGLKGMLGGDAVIFLGMDLIRRRVNVSGMTEHTACEFRIPISAPWLAVYLSRGI